ncbi:MAG: response regulator [Thermodesulfobacteriota bacterium]
MEDIRILLVDDEEDFVTTISELLQLRNLASQTAFSGEQAIGYVGEKEPDVMVLDLKMPGIDGMEVLRQVRRLYPHIQVIIQTGHGSNEEETEARKIGVFDYFKKPVDIDLLVTRIKEAAQTKRTLSGETGVSGQFSEGAAA